MVNSAIMQGNVIHSLVQSHLHHLTSSTLRIPVFVLRGSRIASRSVIDHAFYDASLFMDIPY